MQISSTFPFNYRAIKPILACIILIQYCNLLSFDVFGFDKNITTAISACAFMLLCAIAFCVKYIKYNCIKLQQFLILAIILFLITISHSASYPVIRVLLLSLILFDESYYELLNTLLIIQIFEILILVVLYYLNIASLHIFDTIELFDRTKYTLANIHPNTLCMFACSLSLLYMLKFQHLYNVPIIMIINYFSFKLTNSRTPFYISFIFCFLLVAQFFLSFKSKKYIKHILLLILVASFTFPFWFSYIYSTFPFLDIILSSRFTLFSRFLSSQNYFTFLFGGAQLPHNLPVDNSYILLLYTCGIFFYIFIFILTCSAILYFYDMAQYYEVIFLLVILFIGFFENIFMYLNFPIASLFWYFIINSFRYRKNICIIS